MNRVQTHRQVAVGTPLGDDVLLFRGMSASEPLGGLFRYELDLVSENHQVDFNALVGGNITVRLALGNDETRYFNGFVSRFAQVGAVGRLSQYRATVVPWLWFLTRTSDCRIFQEKAVPEILKQVFRDHGFTDFKDALAGSYPTWEYCVQYRETDFNFVSRLMEQEGIYYFFEHDNGKHTLVLADGLGAHDKVPDYETIPYRPADSGYAKGEYITDWTEEQTVQPGAYAMTDFDFEHTNKDLQTRRKIPREHAQSEFELYDYPGEYHERDTGDQYARVRIEELQARHRVARGEGDVRGIATGATFELTNAPRPDQEKEYLVTSAEHELTSDEYETGSGEGGAAPYTVSFTAIDAQEPYRPARRTPKPVIQGPQTAIVVGKSGEEIWTDEYGRVKVLFHWDRYGQADETSSCWIRVAQGWAGKQWGQLFVPRIGQEVIVEFLEGDPDRPIITGRVYNGNARPPYSLPENKTLSTLKSNSSKGGGGFNEFRFEDKAGEEQVFLHAQKNQDIRVKKDCYEWIGNDRHLIVKTDQREHIENDRHDTIDRDHNEKIGRDRHTKIAGKEARSVGGSHSHTVKGDVSEKFQANHSEQVTQNYYLKAMGTVIESSTGITLKCGANSVVIDPAGVTVTGNMLVLDGSMVNIASGPGSPPASGQAGQAVSPAAPQEPEEADLADPGEMAKIKAEQQKTGKGKYGATSVKPFKPPQSEEEKQDKSWIEIELVDEEDNPVPGERYEVTLPDGETVASGTLDENGFARVEGIDPGECKVTFPELDREAWERA